MKKSTFIKNIRIAFKKAGYNTERGFPAWLAKRYGVSNQAVNGWLQESSNYPKLEVLVQMAQDTGVSVEALLTAELNESALEHSNQLPLYNMNNYLDKSTVVPDEWIYPANGEIENRIAIRQFGDSMDERFPDGSVLIINTDKKIPPNGGLVLAKLANGQLLFRRYVNEGVTYLMPLNSAYENYTDNFEVIGVFEYAIIKSEII